MAPEDGNKIAVTEQMWEMMMDNFKEIKDTLEDLKLNQRTAGECILLHEAFLKERILPAVQAKKKVWSIDRIILGAITLAGSGFGIWFLSKIDALNRLIADVRKIK